MPRLPPGPRFTPLVVYRYARNPYDFFVQARKRYGDPFMMPTAMGIPTLVTGSPEGLRAMFSEDSATYGSYGGDHVMSAIGPYSLFILDGDAHKRERKLLMPPFHGARMRAYGDLMRGVALEHAARWRAGQRFEMVEATLAISLDITARVIFGVAGADRVEAFGRALTECIEAFTPLLWLIKAARRDIGGVTPWGKFLAAKRRFDQLLYGLIRVRRSEGTAGRHDILSLFLEARQEDGAPLSDQHIRDEIVTLLAAGHDTIGTALGWAFHLTHADAAIRQRLVDELASLGPDPDTDAIAELPYLDAVMQETLRLYPDPLRFRPERFLERRFSPFEFLPFGGGARRCIGAALSLYQMKVVFAALLSQHRLRLADAAPVVPVRRNVAVMGPSGGVPMTLEARVGARREAARAV
jgi:cytochrome P450